MKIASSYKALLDHKLWKKLKHMPKGVIYDIVIASFCANLLIMALPVFTRAVYDRIIPNFATDTLWVLMAGMAMVVLFDFFFKAARAWMTLNMSGQASKHIDHYMVKALLKKSDYAPYAKVNYHMNSAHEVSNFYCTKLIPTAIDLPFSLAFLGIIYMLSPAMMMVPLMCGLAIIGVQIVLHSKINHAIMDHHKNAQDKNHSLVEIINGFTTIKHMVAQKIFSKKWYDISAKANMQNADLQFSYQFVGHINQSIMMLNTVLLMAVGVYQINLNNMSIGALIAVSILSSRILSPLIGIGEVAAKMPKILHQKDDAENFVSEENILCGGDQKVSLKGNILFKNISLQIDKKTILKECNFLVENHEKIAIVGPSGAGKSSLLKMAAAQYIPTMGEIFYDHYDRKNLDQNFMQKQIAVVDQYPYFFEGTLKENLTMGRKISEDDITSILSEVGLLKEIQNSGYGLDLPLAAGGTNLSGGQKQLLAIVRALLCRPKILIMDEPTSMMDHQTEQRIVLFLQKHIENVTTLIVTHRSPMLELVERMVVMQQGKIIKDGLRYDVLDGLAKSKA